MTAFPRFFSVRSPSVELSGIMPTLNRCRIRTLTERGAVCVRTQFMYPDGDIIDVFVEPTDETYSVTDYGEALGWLQLQSFSDKLTPNQRVMIEDICMTLGIQFDMGELKLTGVDESPLGDTIHRLGQASVRVSDIWLTLRNSAVVDVADEVEQ